MKNIKTLLITLFLIICSCKDQKETIQDFTYDANNNVDIPVNDNVNKALNYISNTQIRIASYCAPVTTREYHVNFYFNITQEVKELIIIQYFNNRCEKSEYGIRVKGEKYTIPIQKIGSVEIADFYSLGGPNIYVDKSNKDVQQLCIKMNYNSNSIIHEFKELNGYRYHTSDMNKENDYNCDNVTVEIPKIQISKLKEAIDILAKEYKL